MKEVLQGLVELVAPRRCAGCDAELADLVAVFCRACASLLQPAESDEAVYEYGGPVADAIHRLKYAGRSDLAARLGQAMGAWARAHVSGVDLVLPVPLHWRRRRARGYDQAALLCVPVARALGLSADLRGLRRVKHTASQVDLGVQERFLNVSGAFEARPVVAGRSVLLVDDVRTTGATFASAQRALERGGAASVKKLALAARPCERGA